MHPSRAAAKVAKAHEKQADRLDTLERLIAEIHAAIVVPAPKPAAEDKPADKPVKK